MSKLRFEDFRHELRPLTESEGGGWLITWPDLPGCMSDGDTPEQAIAHGREAFADWFVAIGDATKGSREDFERFLRKVPSVPPMPGDERE